MNFNEKELNVGVFIDGENFSYTEYYLYENEITKYGNIIVKRLYGDYSTNFNEIWKKSCITYGIEQIHCPKLPRKNSVDMKLIDDIYDFLYCKKSLDTYILISNDADFLTACNKVRSFGKKFIILGSNTCSVILKKSCDLFTSIQKNNEEVEKIEKIEKIEEIEEINKKNKNKNRTVKTEVKFSENDKNNFLKVLIKIFENNKRYYILNSLKQKIRKTYSNKLVELNLTKLSKLEYVINHHLSDYFVVINSNEKGKNKKVVYYLASYNSDEYRLLLEQIKSIFFYFNCNKLQSSVLKEKLLSLTTDFDNKDFGFNKFTDFLSAIYKDHFKIMRINTTDYVINIHDDEDLLPE